MMNTLSFRRLCLRTRTPAQSSVARAVSTSCAGPHRDTASAEVSGSYPGHLFPTHPAGADLDADALPEKCCREYPGARAETDQG